MRKVGYDGRMGIEHGNNMEIPQVSPPTSSDAGANPPLRWSWRQLLVAYCVHHVTSFIGLLCTAIYFRKWNRISNPSTLFDFVLAIPVSDAYYVTGPLFDLQTGWPKDSGLQLLRGAIVIALVGTCVAYARRRSLPLLGIIGVASMLLYFSLVIYRPPF
jgi:hypothetical protein